MQSVDVISIDLSFSVMAVCLNWLNHLWFTDEGEEITVRTLFHSQAAF